METRGTMQVRSRDQPQAIDVHCQIRKSSTNEARIATFLCKKPILVIILVAICQVCFSKLKLCPVASKFLART
jgi:hypothetical protein